MDEWRTLHPKATFDKIEKAIDERLTRLRRQMLEDSLKLKSSLTGVAASPQKGENCERVLHKRGKHIRKLLSSGGTQITLEFDLIWSNRATVPEIVEWSEEGQGQALFISPNSVLPVLLRLSKPLQICARLY